jgi:hypothetical protein
MMARVLTETVDRTHTFKTETQIDSLVRSHNESGPASPIHVSNSGRNARGRSAYCDTLTGARGHTVDLKERRARSGVYGFAGKLVTSLQGSH